MQAMNNTEIQEIYESQLAYKSVLKQCTVQQRTSWLRLLKSAILCKEERIKEALYKDFRKNPFETESTELLPVLLEINHFLKKLPRWMKPKKAALSLLFASTAAYTVFEPKGNTLIITPWNYPFQLPMVHLIASICAGNTVILKLSEFTPNINSIIEEIIGEVFERRHVAVVEGGVEETSYLLNLKFDHIHFTGSSKVGKIVMTAAAKHLADITLELGGKSPVFVDRNVELRDTVRNLIWAKFVNMGQTCIAPDYLLVDEQLKDALEKTLCEEMKAAFGDNPLQSIDLARIINRQHFDRLKGYLDELRNGNASLIYGGNHDAEALFVHPTIVTNVPEDCALMQEEIFGPILPIRYYKHVEEALDFVNAKEKPLALYIFSKDKKYVSHVMQRTTAGGTTINDAMLHIMHPNLPFGGVNNSGIGQSTGYFGFKAFSHERSLLKASAIPMSKFFWYPYSANSRNIMKWIRKFFQ